MEKIRVGVIGLGARGDYLVDLLLTMDDILVTAVSDIYQDRVDKNVGKVEKAQGQKPLGAVDYREVIAAGACDAAVVVTGWEKHVEIGIALMEAGIAVGMEVGGAYSVADCWRLIEAYERTGTPFMFLENCNYGRYELLVRNMAEQGLFGEIVHCSGGYMHDLRTEVLYGRENRHYRLKNYIERNCHNYPTHDLGPIAQVMNIGRGNRILYLTSMSSAARGLNDYAALHENVDPALRTTRFAQGDIVVTSMMCENGATITLKLDTTLPRPYSRGFTVQGTRGMYQEDGNFIYLDTDFTEADHFDWKKNWDNADKYLEKYEHPIWRKFLNDGVRGGHGGMDYLVYDDFFTALREGLPMPIDVYDAALLMSITPLSAESIKGKSKTVEVPDFFAGRNAGGNAAGKTRDVKIN